MRNHTWYTCSGSKTGNWPEGEYLIDHADIKQNSIMIWHKQAWAISPVRSVKKAFAILTEEFTNVEKIDR